MRRAALVALSISLMLSVAIPTMAFGIVCDPRRTDDNKARYVGTFISASSGNLYTGVSAWIENNTPFVDEPPTEAWIALYPPAGRKGIAYAGLRYYGGSAAPRAFFVIMDGHGAVALQNEIVVNEGDHHFSVQWVSDYTGPLGTARRGYRIYLDGVLWGDKTYTGQGAGEPLYGGMWYPPTRAYALGRTSSLGSQILGHFSDRTSWTSLKYQRNFQTFTWPAAPNFRNDFGADASVVVPAAGQMDIYDRDCLS